MEFNKVLLVKSCGLAILSSSIVFNEVAKWITATYRIYMMLIFLKSTWEEGLYFSLKMGGKPIYFSMIHGVKNLYLLYILAFYYCC